MNKIHFSGNDLIIDADELDSDLLADLLDCGTAGDSTESVLYVFNNYDITGDEKDCKAFLSSYGAWTDSELSDHDENLQRLIWLTGCSLHEGESAYFSSY